MNELEEIEQCVSVIRCRRKSDQHWEMAGMARMDGDREDEKRHAALAQAWSAQARELVQK